MTEIFMSTETETADTVFCRDCGTEIDARAEICPECGIRQRQPTEDRDSKSPGLAAVLSFLVPGLGQIYNGQVGKGLLILVFVVVLFALIVTSPVIAGGLAFLTWVLAIYDAYTQAERYNEGEELDF